MLNTMRNPIGMLPAGLLLVLVASSCNNKKDSPGLEYMPDMYRSPAVEAYVDYGQDPYYFGDSLATAQRATPSARLPVEGTIPFAESEADAACCWAGSSCKCTGACPPRRHRTSRSH